VIADALSSAGVIMLIIAAALVFSHWGTGSELPARLVEFAVKHGVSSGKFLLAMNPLLLIVPELITCWPAMTPWLPYLVFGK
jgi:C4-dicarboxylate transporter DctM subunit